MKLTLKFKTFENVSEKILSDDMINKNNEENNIEKKDVIKTKHEICI